MPDAARSWRPVFVLGTGRCGSTLVHEVLARHRDTAWVSNVDDRVPRASASARWNGAIYRRIPPALTRKGRLRFAPSEGYRTLDREVSPVLSAPCRDLGAADATPWLAARFRAFVERRAVVPGHAVFLHKFTGWPRAGFVHAVFPDARFVHVVRDGRAVANSWVQMPWFRGFGGPEAWQFGPLPAPYAEEWARAGRSFPLLAGIGWKILVDAFAAARAAVPETQWLEIRYEDVLEDPRGQVKRVLEFMGLDWDDDFERAFAVHEFRTERSAAFRRDLDARSLELLDASLADHLRRFGYDVGGTAT